MRARRRSRRIQYVLLGLFVGVTLFTCLAQRFKGDGSVDAASLVNFDPGYIISDYQMGNYTSMSEAEIQAFLTAKNPCSNTNYEYYKALSVGSSARWHFKDGHFVCLSEELFGDGEVIGEGETAAHIIWQTAQDYKINPQVLLVLLQKETGLITDPIPNNYDYRKATGYGCPDTAPCSSEYYGFKNQIRKAAALFRTVLDGGWTNYPLGNNYVQYNPNAACGGSVVNIRSLATSALYRYTPYQPNAGALAAGYGTASCGAYGNRNFYLYFEDWFGGIMNEEYIKMEDPRYMQTKENVYKINPNSLDELELVEFGRNVKFVSKIQTSDGETCLRSEYDTKKNNNACIRLNNLDEFNGLEYVELDTPRYFLVPVGAYIINSVDGSVTRTAKNEKVFFNTKSYWAGGLCLRSEKDTEKNIQACILYNDLEEIRVDRAIYVKMASPRMMMVDKDTLYYDSDVNLKLGEMISRGERLVFVEKTTLDTGALCLRTVEDLSMHNNRCILINELSETTKQSGSEYIGMERKRYFSVLHGASYVTTSGYYYGSNIDDSQNVYFVDKTYIEGRICLRTYSDRTNNVSRCVMLDDLVEVGDLVFVGMDRARELKTSNKTVVVDFDNRTKLTIEGLKKLYFVDKTIWNGKMCVRANEDAIAGQNKCYLFESLDE